MLTRRCFLFQKTFERLVHSRTNSRPRPRWWPSSAEGWPRAASQWPFQEDSPLCREHGTRLPFVQGPMAHVSDNPDFLAAVGKHGALPFLAMGNMPAGIAKEAAARAWESTGGKFGVGLIGLEANRPTYEAHLEIMKEATAALCHSGRGRSRTGQANRTNRHDLLPALSCAFHVDRRLESGSPTFRLRGM